MSPEKVLLQPMCLMRLRLGLLAVTAVSMGLVQAQEAQRMEEGSVSLGVGLAGGSDAARAQFGQHNRLWRERSIGLGVGVDYLLRDQGSGQWADIRGRELLSNSRELTVVYKNPGRWVVTVDYGEGVRFEPNRLNSGLAGWGTARPIVNALSGGPGSGADFDLSVHRQKLKIGLGNQLTTRLHLHMRLGFEKKNGTQTAGVGASCPSLTALSCDMPTLAEAGWATLFLPVPVGASHSTFDVRLSYAHDPLKFSVGYQGSFYRNDYTSVVPVVPGSLFNGALSLLPLTAGLQAYLQQPLALAPDNQAHQLDLAGVYDINSANRVTFKLARSIASQNANFAQAGLSAGAPSGVQALGGHLTSDWARLGLVSRPSAKLSLSADWRYDNRDDATPLQQYGGVPWTNQPMSLERRGLKFQANWQFSSVYRGSLGANFEEDDRGPFARTAAVGGLSALRQQTSESTWSAALRRRMTDDFSGMVTWSSARRDGSLWLRPLGGASGVVVVDDARTGFITSSIFMPTLADRKRDKLRLSADWQRDEKLSMQFHADLGHDGFELPGKYGLKGARMSAYGLDMNYAHSLSWNWHGFVARGSQTLNQGWADGLFMAFENISTSLGLGFSGKLKSAWTLGANLSHAFEKDVYQQTLDESASALDISTLAASGGLPDIRFRQSHLTLFATYAIDKQSAVRLDLVRTQTQLSDWSWSYAGVPYTYSDGTTLSQSPQQLAHFLGVRYIYRWK